MDAKSMKQSALIIQLAGFVVLLLGTRGFVIFSGTPLYFPALIAGVVIFAICLFKGGAMHKKAKELERMSSERSVEK